MHGGEHVGWKPGRGFVGSPSMSEPESAASAEDTDGPAWGDVHARLLADYEQRRGAHDKEVAKFGRSEQRRSESHTAQRRQALGSGELGFREFWAGRTELSGTPAYEHDWLTLKRPAVQRGVGPMGSGRVGKLVERKTAQRTLANRGSALEAEGMVLAALPPGIGDAAPDAPFTTAPSVLSGGPSSAYPRSGALRPGTQFSRVAFANLDE